MLCSPYVVGIINGYYQNECELVHISSFLTQIHNATAFCGAFEPRVYEPPPRRPAGHASHSGAIAPACPAVMWAGRARSGRAFGCSRNRVSANGKDDRYGRGPTRDIAGGASCMDDPCVTTLDILAHCRNASILCKPISGAGWCEWLASILKFHLVPSPREPGRPTFVGEPAQPHGTVFDGLRHEIGYMRTSSATNVGRDKDSETRPRAAIEATPRRPATPSSTGSTIPR
jgi:hypothetical protein